MNVFGLSITRDPSVQTLGLSTDVAALVKAAPSIPMVTDTSAFSRGWTRILESFSGAWQRNIEVSTESVLTFAAVYSCVTLIASDIAKLQPLLVQRDEDGIWTETENASFSPFLRKPNHFQTRIKFYEQWVISKLIHGNAYILKERDRRNVVVGGYVLDPQRVRPMVAPDGSVFYQLNADALSGLSTAVVVPAREVIHDVMVPLFHPLCGVSPLTACGLAAAQGLRVQAHSAKFFEQGANPGGVLSAPGDIPKETADRLTEYWNNNFSGDNVGKVAVLGNGLKYERMAMTAVDAQLIEQLKWTAENVCTAFHVPAYMVGVGQPPAYNNIEALNQQYYSQCLQTHIESIELLLDEGLGLVQDGGPQTYGVEFDLDQLLRMDTMSRVTAAKESLNGGGMTANESRRIFHGLGPVTGGDAVLSQQQNFSLAALAKRDARPDPFAPASSSGPSAVADPAPADVTPKRAEAIFRKHLRAA